MIRQCSSFCLDPNILSQPHQAKSVLKLPLLLVLLELLLLRPIKPFFDEYLVDVSFLLLCFEPARKKKTVDRSRHANAAHMKAKAYWPILASLPLERKASRPWT